MRRVGSGCGLGIAQGVRKYGPPVLLFAYQEPKERNLSLLILGSIWMGTEENLSATEFNQSARAKMKMTRQHT